MGDIRSQARVHYESGLSKFHRNDYTAALEYFLRALTFAEQSRDSILSISILMNLAMSHSKLGQTFEAFQAYSDALKRADATMGAAELREEMLIRIGNAYLETKDRKSVV